MEGKKGVVVDFVREERRKKREREAKMERERQRKAWKEPSTSQGKNSNQNLSFRIVWFNVEVLFSLTSQLHALPFQT